MTPTQVTTKEELNKLDEPIKASNTAQIPLTKGYFTTVDVDDFEWLSKVKWYYSGGYAKRAVYIPQKDGRARQKGIAMHRAIMNPENGITVDHIDGNKLNNTRQNLRLATYSQNNANRLSHRNSSSKYKGVTFDENWKKWRTTIVFNKKKVFRAAFDSEVDAAIAYDENIEKYFGEFAVKNFPIIDKREE